MPKRRDYEILGDAQLAPEEAERFDQMEAQAEREIEELRVNFRWGASQVEMVKKAAELMGIPYQTYIKEAAFRAAVADVRAATAARKIVRRAKLG